MLIIRKNQEGQAALLIVLITMSLLLFVVLSITDMTARQTRVTTDAFRSVQAYYLADAGTERILYLSKGISAIDPGGFSVGGIIFDESIAGLGSFKAIKTSDSPLLKLQITGYFQGIARAVELSW